MKSIKVTISKLLQNISALPHRKLLPLYIVVSNKDVNGIEGDSGNTKTEKSLQVEVELAPCEFVEACIRLAITKIPGKPLSERFSHLITNYILP